MAAQPVPPRDRSTDRTTLAVIALVVTMLNAVGFTLLGRARDRSHG